MAAPLSGSDSFAGPRAKTRRPWRAIGVAVAATATVLGVAVVPATPAAAATVTCSSSTRPALAAALIRDIAAAHRGRTSTVAVWVDGGGKFTCSVNGSARFDSASVVKVTILGALLRKALDQHRYLTSTEASRARAMITTSDNNAASALWSQLGRSYIQHFLNLAGMKQTTLGPGGYWGLTQITAHDESLLLRVLLRGNTILSNASRAYALGLMAQVISSQRWGVPAGAPRTLVVHVKNGWLPRATHGWRIHSIGGFTWSRGWYSIVVLTQDNSTMAYGIATVEAIARAINHDLNPSASAVIAPSAVSPSWGQPDEQIPALPAIP